MKGNICIVSETGWAVSNDAVLDSHRERVDTPEGPKMMPYSMFEAINPFSTISEGERVKVAFQAEDGNPDDAGGDRGPEGDGDDAGAGPAQG